MNCVLTVRERLQTNPEHLSCIKASAAVLDDVQSVMESSGANPTAEVRFVCIMTSGYQPL